MNKAPLFGLVYTPTRVSVTRHTTPTGLRRYVVRAGGQQRTVTVDHRANNTLHAAIRDAFGGIALHITRREDDRGQAFSFNVSIPRYERDVTIAGNR